ncbi:MAG: pyridoxal-phosphate dependent enzyme [Alphaproteobacteria bacterium]|nr:pyridoxal-phosphate dependent enzyme [Alphaproteobacteria bacterium]
MTDIVTLADIEAAAHRIADGVRLTPLVAIGPVKTPPLPPGPRPPFDLALKLECLQVTGSFKPRGALNKLAQIEPANVARGVVTASAGNHGLGVAYAAWRAGVPARIYLPAGTPADKQAKIAAWGAELVVEGAVWDEANAAAMASAHQAGLTYIHPFADPAVIAGQGTLGREILTQLPGADTLIVAIGGGGLIAGVAIAAKAINPGIRVVGVEPVGAPTLFESLKAGHLVTLGRIETAAGTLAPRRSMAINLAIVKESVDRIVLVSDAEMEAAARWLWFEQSIAAELSGAAALAALTAGRYVPEENESVVAIVCGAGTDGIAPGARGW